MRSRTDAMSAASCAVARFVEKEPVDARAAGVLSANVTVWPNPVGVGLAPSAGYGSLADTGRDDAGDDARIPPVRVPHRPPVDCCRRSAASSAAVGSLPLLNGPLDVSPDGFQRGGSPLPGREAVWWISCAAPPSGRGEDALPRERAPARRGRRAALVVLHPLPLVPT